MYWLCKLSGPEKKRKQIQNKMKAQMTGSYNIIKKARKCKSEEEN